MRLKFLAVNAAAFALAALLVSCKGSESVQDNAMPNGEFIYNVPCKVVNIHQELEGKSILFLWLHGGVHDVSKHDLFEFNHLDCCAADDSVLNYLQKKNIKAIALFPVCHRAGDDHPVHWRDCWGDVKRIIDDYTGKGLIDTDRIYLAGSSDGGVGTWDYAEMHPEVFAVGLSMSCSTPHKVTIPIYFFNTSDEEDTSADVEALKAQGCDITFKHCPQFKHGGDAAECTEEFLDKFFSYRKQ